MKSLMWTLCALSVLCACQRKTEPQKTDHDNTALYNVLNDREQRLESLHKTLETIDGELADITDQNSYQLQNSSGEKKLVNNIFGNLNSARNQLLDLRMEVFDMAKKAGEEQHVKSSLKLRIDQLVHNLNDESSRADGLYKAWTNELANNKGLQDSLFERGRQLASLQNQINQVHLYWGSPKELKSEGVCKKTGAFLGLGGHWEMESTAPDSLFINVNASKVAQIPFATSKIELASMHPADSYEVKETTSGATLIIKDPVKFWQYSHYLTVVTL